MPENATCGHCGALLGLGRFLGSRFCSREHQALYEKQRQRSMLERLQRSASRLDREPVQPPAKEPDEPPA